MTRRQLPSEHELRAMVGQGRRTLNELRAAVRGLLIDGRETAGIRQEIAETRGRVAEWEMAIQEIVARENKIIADQVAGLRFEIGVGAVGAISDKIMALQPPPFPTSNVQGAPL